jgi:hypothetical protein
MAQQACMHTGMQPINCFPNIAPKERLERHKELHLLSTTADRHMQVKQLPNTECTLEFE